MHMWQILTNMTVDRERQKLEVRRGDYCYFSLYNLNVNGLSIIATQ